MRSAETPPLGDRPLAEQRLSFLQEASALLAVALDLDAVLQQAAQVTVPALADWCFVDLIQPDGSARRVAAAHADLDRAATSELMRDPPSPTRMQHEAMTSGEAILFESVTDDDLVAYADDETHLAALRIMAPRSAIAAPLIARGQNIGVLTLVMSESGRTYSHDDLPIARDIARRAALAADNALLYAESKDANARFRALVDSIEAIVWEADADPFRFRFVSKQEVQILGYPVERWLSDPDLTGSIVHPDDLDEVRTAFVHAVETARTMRLEYRVRAADGRWVWIETAIFAGVDESGAVTTLRGLTTDITARKRHVMYERAQSAVDRVLVEAETAAEVPARLLQAVCETIGWEMGALWRIDESSDTMRCEEFWHDERVDVHRFRAATLQSRFSRGAGLPGRVWSSSQPTWITDVTHDANFPRAPYAQAEGVHGAVGFPIQSGGRVLGVVELYSTEVQEPDEDLLTRMGTIGAQIGQYLERRRYEEAALDNDARTRAVVEAALDAVVMMDEHGMMLEFNPAAETLLGFKREDVIGKPVAETIVPPSLRERHRLGLARHLVTGEAKILGSRAEFTAMRADHTEIPIELSVSRVDAPGPPVFAASIRDISGRVQSERRRETQYAVTRALNESQSLDDAAAKILETVGAGLGWQIGVMWRVDPQVDVLRAFTTWAHDPDAWHPFLEVARETSIRRGEGVAGRVWQARRALWFAEGALRRTLLPVKSALARDLRAAFALPIPGRQQTLGVLEFFSNDAQPPDADLLAMMESAGIQIGQFMDRREIEDATRFQKVLLESQADATIEGIAMTSPDGKLLSYNLRFAEMFAIDTAILAAGDAKQIARAMFSHLADPSIVEHFVALASDLVSYERGELTFADGRSFDRYTAPLRGEDGEVYGRAWYFRDITERKRSETALENSNRRLGFLAEAGTVLAASLDLEQTMQSLARLLVPELADWAAIEILRPDGTLERVGLEGIDAAGLAVLEGSDIPSVRRVDPSALRGTDAVVRTGLAEWSPTVDDEWLQDAAGGDHERLALLRSMGFRSYMCVPLIARGHILGVLTLASSRSGRRYNATDLAFAEDVAKRAAVAVDNARLYAEREHVARTLQDSLLPPELPQIPGAEIAAVYHAAAAGIDVGGDFYDLFETGDDEWALVIGDVCGKGAPAAAITALARYTLRAAAMQARKPSRVLSTLNEAILRQQTEERFCTVAYARIASGVAGEPRRVTVSCGGHPPPLILRRSGKVESFEAPGGLLGVFEDPGLTEASTMLEPGDALVLYTDGVIEARALDEFVGDSGLRELLATFAGSDATGIAERIGRFAIDVQSGEPRDDIAVIVLRAL